MRVWVLTIFLSLPAFAANQAACQDRCGNMIGVCQDQCTQRFPKNKQDACKSACKAALPKCEERCKGEKK